MTRTEMTAGPLVGRQSELERLGRFVDGDSTERLVTVTGRGGVGKTRLAHAAAERASRSGVSAVWVDLTEHTAGDHIVPAILDAALGSDVGVPFPLDEFAALTSLRPTLLVLDNFEHLTDSSVIVDDLLQRCPDLRILVTSRLPLPLSTGRRLRLGPLSVAPATGSISAAEELLVIAARRVVEPAALADDHAALVELCRMSAGVPLSIELLAAQLAVRTPTELVDELYQSSLLHVAGPLGLTETIEFTTRRLNDAEHALFRRLSVFPGAFDLDSAAAVAGFGALERSDVGDQLTTLVDLHLVEPVSSPGELRFALLVDVREFAASLLERAGEEDVATTRHLERCLGLVERGPTRVDTPEHQHHLERLIADEADIRVASERALARGRFDDCGELLEALSWLWAWRGPLDQQVERADAMLACLDGNARPSVVSRARLAISRLRGLGLGDDGRAGRVAADLDDAHRLAEHHGDVALALLACAFEFWNLQALADIGRVRAAMARGRQLAGRVDDRWWEARFQMWGAMLAHQDGDRDEASRLAIDALHAATELGDARALASSAVVLKTLPSRWSDGVTVPATADLVATATAAGDRATLSWLLLVSAMESLTAGTSPRRPQMSPRRCRHCAHAAGGRCWRLSCAPWPPWPPPVATIAAWPWCTA